jgi:hypothetical protein
MIASIVPATSLSTEITTGNDVAEWRVGSCRRRGTTSIITRLPIIRLKLTEIELCGWLGQALPGDVIEYHRGFLAIDCIPQGGRLTERDRSELVRVGRRALWAADRGIAYLIQRRHGPDDYSYLVIARPRPDSPSQPLSELPAAEVDDERS